jgi:hypothetical protein
MFKLWDRVKRISGPDEFNKTLNYNGVISDKIPSHHKNIGKYQFFIPTLYVIRFNINNITIHEIATDDQIKKI